MLLPLHFPPQASASRHPLFSKEGTTNRPCLGLDFKVRKIRYIALLAGCMSRHMQNRQSRGRQVRAWNMSFALTTQSGKARFSYFYCFVVSAQLCISEKGHIDAATEEDPYKAEQTKNEWMRAAKTWRCKTAAGRNERPKEREALADRPLDCGGLAVTAWLRGRNGSTSIREGRNG